VTKDELTSALILILNDCTSRCLDDEEDYDAVLKALVEGLSETLKIEE
jgi:hypothetical protein